MPTTDWIMTAGLLPLMLVVGRVPTFRVWRRGPTSALGGLALLLACWLWLFAWPRFLVPPHLRGQPGWVTASWRMWRADRLRRANGE